MNNELKDMMMLKLLLDMAQPASDNQLWQVGKSYLVRTVTMYCLGKLKIITGQELLFESASWVADCGRFNNALKTGQLNEVEPFLDDVIVNRSSIIDATLWRFDLPKEVKE
jgi:hypothetical protein